MDFTNPLKVLARTAYGEARGDGHRGMQAVCNVVMNRAAHPRWWGDTPLAVCLAPYQFSAWDTDDPNRAKILAVTPQDGDYALALVLAKMALAGRLPDITGGADSYYDLSEPVPPSWSETATRTCVIGSQAFYRVELPPPVAAPSEPERSGWVERVPDGDAEAEGLNEAELRGLG